MDSPGPLSAVGLRTGLSLSRSATAHPVGLKFDALLQEASLASRLRRGQVPTGAA